MRPRRAAEQRASLAGCPSPSSPIRRHTCPRSSSRATASTSSRSTSSCPAARAARAWTSSPDDVARALAVRGQTVSTSRPTPGDFVAAYRRALDAGADQLVSIHLSGELSGTSDAARLAASQVGEHLVTVVDSRSAAMGCGFAVLAAARVRRRRRRRRGGRRGRPADRARDPRRFFVVDTLEHLRRGGRIGAAAARPRLGAGGQARAARARTAGSCRWRRCARPPARSTGSCSGRSRPPATARCPSRCTTSPPPSGPSGWPAELRERLPGAARAARQRARRRDRRARRARRGRRGRRAVLATGRTSGTGGERRRESGGTWAAACRRAPAAPPVVHRRGSDPQIRRAAGPLAMPLPSVRPVRLPSRRSDDADVIRARLRALLDGERRVPGLAARRRPGRRPEPERLGRRSRSTVPVAAETGTSDAACPPGSAGTARPAGRRAGTRAGRVPGRCGSPAWSPRSLLVGWTWLDRPQVEPVAGRRRRRPRPRRSAAGRRRRSGRSPRPRATVVVSVVGSVARPGLVTLPAGVAGGRRGRGRRRPAARRRPGVGQPRRRRHRRPADRGGRARRAAAAGGRPEPPAGAAAGWLNLNTATAAELDALPGHRTGAGPADRRPPHSRGRSPASTSSTTCPASARRSPPSSPSW